MAGSNNSSAIITLETTPTWAVAVVCFILITISILIEHALHLLAKVRLTLSLSLYQIVIIKFDFLFRKQ